MNARHVVNQLQGALTSRVVIEQAKGVLAERINISVDSAFARLRAHARRIGDVARELLDGQLDATTLTEAVPEGPPLKF
ncbi:MAG: ANTAR domain-containing protein [Solirubrobacterales bacterium]|nr:ANTAR domain-containing protein [Solirubrobacterales bacterium]